MQKTEDGMVVIACDFTGIEWDEEVPMIEGHRGSVICLDALALAVTGVVEATEAVLGAFGEKGSGLECTMCTRPVETGQKIWRHPDPPQDANPAAVICWDCIQQADRAFAKDPDTSWERQIESDDRWR